ncbi:hypothetical protein NDU88_001073 [Pleurodeles waltl]|uniref:Uncharacterized protein n=1 Tax=Pleurodeles waltl TaxID=8319 RepID=A0AAV7MMP3_PLEWA|nr:hypothetical protein NDU88_001073 [Pleurodeles waltl]
MESSLTGPPHVTMEVKIRKKQRHNGGGTSCNPSDTLYSTQVFLVRLTYQAEPVWWVLTFRLKSCLGLLLNSLEDTPMQVEHQMTGTTQDYEYTAAMGNKDLKQSASDFKQHQLLTHAVTALNENEDHLDQPITTRDTTAILRKLKARLTFIDNKINTVTSHLNHLYRM